MFGDLSCAAQGVVRVGGESRGWLASCAIRIGDSVDAAEAVVGGVRAVAAAAIGVCCWASILKCMNHMSEAVHGRGGCDGLAGCHVAVGGDSGVRGRVVVGNCGLAGIGIIRFFETTQGIVV